MSYSTIQACENDLGWLFNLRSDDASMDERSFEFVLSGKFVNNHTEQEGSHHWQQTRVRQVYIVGTPINY